MNFKNIKIIVQKELKAYFDSPLAYIVLAVFIFLWQFLFFKGAFLIGLASLRPLFDLLPWLLLLLIPPITMGSISQELSDGTIEFLFTKPIREKEILLGKYLASCFFVLLGIFLTLPLPLIFSFFGRFDWGVVFGQYLGAVFLTGAFVALGTFVSSYFKNQIVSFMVSAVAGFFLIISGFEFVTIGLPYWLSWIFERVSLLAHFQSLGRGVVDLRDIVYFLSFAFIFLGFAYLQLLKIKTGKTHNKFREASWQMLVVTLILVLVNILGQYIPGRLDLTEGRFYSLSPATKKVVRALPDIVNIQLYSSSKLPAQFQAVLRQVKDSLRDYQSVSRGKVRVSYKYPDLDEQVEKDAYSLGLRAVQFNVMSREEFKVQKGFLGLVISYAGEHETIPFIQKVSNLEYQLTSLIRKLSFPGNKKVVFLSGYGTRNLYADFRSFKNELEKNYKVTTSSLAKDEDIPEQTDLLIIPGPRQAVPREVREKIARHIKSGGSALFLIDAIDVKPQRMFAQINKNDFSDFVKKLGVTVNKDLVYDLKAKERVSFGGGFISYVLPYPFWVILQPGDSSTVSGRIEKIMLPWASSLTVDKDLPKDIKVSRHFTTTDYAGSVSGFYNLSPEQEFKREDLSKKLMAVSLTGKMLGGEKESRVIVVGNSAFIADTYGARQHNLDAGLTIVDWLAQDLLLSRIRSKSAMPRPLLFSSDGQKTLVKYLNYILVGVIIFGFGLIRFLRRKKVLGSPYEK